MTLTLAAVVVASASARAAPVAVATASGMAQAMPQQWPPSSAVFVENRGQWPNPSVRYRLNGRGVNVALRQQGVDIRLAGPGGAVKFSVRFADAQRTDPVGTAPSREVFHYYVGPSAHWRENVPAWNAVVYRKLYPGIDLRLTPRPTGLKYEFHVAPGADWRAVKVHYAGAERLELRADGSLAVHLRKELPPLVDGAPVFYQERHGQRILVPGRFALLDATTCGFVIEGNHDPALPLVIDPVIEWGSYVHEPSVIGGPSALAVATDSAGNVLLTGESPCFVTKLNPAGAHVWTAYFPSNYTGRALALDGSNNVIVGGFSAPGSDVNGFVTKLDAAGLHQWTHTPRGGVNGLDVDDQGRTVVAGRTGPLAGPTDGYVAVYESDGTFAGDEVLYYEPYPEFHINTSAASDVRWGGLGEIYVTGHGDFCYLVETLPMVYEWVCNSATFLARLRSANWWQQVDWATEPRMALDAAGNIILARTHLVAQGPNVAKYSGINGSLLWSVWLSGLGLPATNTWSQGVAVDAAGNIFLTGWTESTNWASGGFDSHHHGRRDAFITKLSSAGAHAWSAYLGGTNHDAGYAVALDHLGNLYVAGDTYSPNWLAGGFDPTYSGPHDAFVVKIRPAANLTVNLGPAPAVTMGAKWRRVGTTNWLEAGSTEEAAPAGHHLVEFLELRDWRAPTPIPVDLADNQSLVLDATYIPRSSELSWASYFGGTSTDHGYGVAVDAQGNVWLTGDTTSSRPFISKWSADGALLWSTKITDFPGPHAGFAVTSDTEGNAIVVGVTRGAYWTVGGYQTNYGGNGDGFVAKLSPNGAPLWSTYLGGTNYDCAYAVAVDAANNILVTGYTASSNWVSGSLDNTHNGGDDAFAVKLSPSGAHLWSTYLGGANTDQGYGIATDPAGNVIVAGSTYSSGWVLGGFDNTYNGGSDAFVIKLNPAGSHLWATYLGGTNSDGANAVTTDPADNLLVTGSTSSTNWISGGFDETYNGGSDAFVFKLSPGGLPLWSTYLGGTNGDAGRGIACDAAGNVLLTGTTSSGGWAAGGPDLVHDGDSDAFVAKLTPGGAHLWSGYLGGTNTDQGEAIATDGVGRVVIAGSAKSPGWMSNGWDTSHNGDWDAFVATLTDRPLPLIRIQSIERVSDSSFRLIFTVTADPPPALQVQRTLSLAAPVSWVPETSAIITPLAPGLFQADVPRQGGQCYHRLHRP
jgi:hypothetical protein